MTAGALSRAPLSTVSVARGAFIALGASIPVATAVDGILTAVIVVAWIAAMRFRETADAVRANPVALTACLWFVAHAVGTLYSSGTIEEMSRAFVKAAMFLLIPIATVVLRDNHDTRLAHYAFMATVALTILLSYLRWGGAIPDGVPLLKDTGYSDSVVFKYHLTQNLLVAYGAFLFAVYARTAAARNTRLLFAGFAILGAANVLLIGDGRTGQIVLMVLAVYYGSWWARGRGAAVALAAIVAVGVVAYAVPGSSLQKRAALTIADAMEWRPGIQGNPSGVKERLEFYRRSLQILEKNPLLGVGSGGFAAADRALASRHGMPATAHPHNEYLLQGVELGVVGPLLLVAMFCVVWRQARRLAEPAHTAAARGLVLMYAFGSLGTSMLNDHAEGLLFVWMTAVLFHGAQTGDTRRR